MLQIPWYTKPQRGVLKDDAHPLTRGLVAHWIMNEGAGGILDDISGNGNPCTLNNMAFPPTPTSGWGYGRLGSALNFDGANDYADAGQPVALQFGSTDPFSISMWANWASGGSGIENAVCYGDVAGAAPAGGDEGYYVSFDDGAAVTEGVFFDYYNGTAFRGTSTGNNVIQRDTWHHILVTSDETNTRINMKIWIDGVLQAQNPRGNDLIGSINYSASNFNIGARDGKANFTGALDDGRVYSRVLSSAEIRWLYREPFADSLPQIIPFVSAEAEVFVPQVIMI